jgi:hypothetical protein
MSSTTSAVQVRSVVRDVKLQVANSEQIVMNFPISAAPDVDVANATRRFVLRTEDDKKIEMFFNDPQMEEERTRMPMMKEEAGNHYGEDLHWARHLGKDGKPKNKREAVKQQLTDDGTVPETFLVSTAELLNPYAMTQRPTQAMRATARHTMSFDCPCGYSTVCEGGNSQKATSRLLLLERLHRKKCVQAQQYEAQRKALKVGGDIPVYAKQLNPGETKIQRIQRLGVEACQAEDDAGWMEVLLASSSTKNR